jgi:hypothetical protein
VSPTAVDKVLRYSQWQTPGFGQKRRFKREDANKPEDPLSSTGTVAKTTSKIKIQNRTQNGEQEHNYRETNEADCIKTALCKASAKVQLG